VASVAGNVSHSAGGRRSSSHRRRLLTKRHERDKAFSDKRRIDRRKARGVCLAVHWNGAQKMISAAWFRKPKEWSTRGKEARGERGKGIARELAVVSKLVYKNLFNKAALSSQ
jgi:hypothetical protein